jgi:fibro-slime domain-containing protein/LPXTG-motif cell wall-anchored protein
VPTVTPTATPEPTEQPQKMYAAKSVDNVQAVSEGGVPATYTLYFAVPKSWIDYTGVTIRAIIGKSQNDPKYELPMKEVSETDDGRKIYSVVLNHQDHYKYGVLGGLEFRGYKGETHTYTVTIVKVDDNNQLRDISFDPVNPNYIGGDYYDGENGDGWHPELWKIYKVGHKHFANKTMAFENKTSETLTNVKAWFYELDTNKTLTPVSEQPISLNDIQPGSTATFAIPKDLCSFVRFTAGDDNTEISEYYNFYNEEVTGEKQKRFQYSEGQCYCYMYNGIEDATWGRPGATRIYYDATFSKMALNGDTDDFSIPKANNNNKETIYYRIKGDDVKSESGTLVKDGTNKNLYYIDIPQGYRSIIFSGEEIGDDNATKGNGVSTEWLPIPTDDKNCFYADTNDDAVYKGTTRGGYWAPKGTLRDAETWKNPDTKVVDIKPAEFTEKPDTKYVTSTLYDYYTDYELNGNNRGSYDKNSSTVSHRNWVPFREFDQALSDYYQAAKAEYPLYTGHFQPAGTAEFSQIAGTLKLFGYDKFKRFMAINNSQYNEDPQNNDNNHTYYAYQGLVKDTTSTGKATGEPLLKGTEIVEPHFNKDFLSGENSKKAKLGEVYENVKFPFIKVKNLFDNETDVDYWCFDSKDTTLYLKQDSGQNSDSKYFLQSADNRESSRNVSASSNSKDLYGYFPFNETAKPGVFSTYNYGFGTKLQMDFTLTDDGMVKTEKTDGTTEKTSIKFFFSGDDDVWVFIDGKLALDVGGAHGEVSGLLEFGESKKDKNKNSVTAYVSKVKTGGTSGSDQDGEIVKTVKYNGEDINFCAKGTTLDDLDKGQKHTLTMYYMERGMWESNMAVAFNFPDNNELQVQKEVELKNVNPAFQDCFKNQKIFNFTIQNQATHYGTKPAAGPNESENPSQHVDLTKGVDIAAATPNKENEYIFRLDENPKQPDPGHEGEKVLHWYARYTDTEPVSYWRKQRYGILTLENPIDIEKMRFLTFQVYTDSKDDGGDLSLNNLYLELLDDKEVQKGSLGTTGINGATYGSVELETGKWVTVKLDLNKMKKQDGFNNKVKFIRVGDNYSRHIYFRNFTFIPKAVPSEMTGFTTDQEKIPDYCSAKSGNLENAENAQYTSNMDTDTQLVDKDGRFVLEAGETVTFSDQFRRGSYISLKEDLNTNLYDTTWTVCENGQAVTSTDPTSTGSASHVILGPSRPLDSQYDPAQGPDDGRTEVYDKNVENKGYTESKKPTPANTIVFRSYKNPDDTSSLTKLKVKYVNTVKTGGLKIQKKAADGEDENIKGTYRFKVTFNNVGGEGLEGENPIERYVDIDMSKSGDHTGTITGIPVNTRYTIEEVGEVKSADGSTVDGAKLQSVTVPDSCRSAHLIKNNTMVEGVIEKSKDPNNPELTAIFTNTKRTLINIEFDKLWEGTDNLSTANRPDTIYIQLQRRLATSQNDADWTPVNYQTANSPDYVTIKYGESRWQFTFSGLDQYQIDADGKQTDYVYRIVEGTVENDKFKQVAPGKTITIKGNTYVVTAKATPKSETDSTGSSTGNTATANSETNSAGSSTDNTATVTPDGTITGGSGKIVLTNTLQNPKFALDIIKKDAERDKNNNEVFLKDVEFKLEKLKAETTEGKTQWVVDKNYKFDSTKTDFITGTTGTDGKITPNPFTNLEPGTYRLTETKAHPGYNLLAQPIEIKFTQDGKCYIDGEEVKKEDKTFNKGANNTYTMTLTVLNRKTPELPHTGADAPSLWLLIGMPLAVAGLLIFTFRYNRKGGRRH